jgi:hypothetical protein
MKKLEAMKTLRALLSVSLLLAGASVLSAKPVDLGTPSGGTPYDRYMAPVKSVLSSLSSQQSSDLDEVRKLMRTGRGFRYSFDTPYVPNMPEVTAKRRAGDCKDKALWLASQLGDANVRFVIGKSRASSKMSHAWLYWKDSTGKWWILDCTYHQAPIAADKVSASSYIPTYSYGKGSSFRHGASGNLAAVASR